MNLPVNNNPLIIGLTGSIATGKSTISQVFSNHKIPVICADLVAQELTQNNPQVLLAIRQEFGENYIDNKGSLKRIELGELVFGDSKQREKLNRIVHPLVKNEIIDQIKQLKAQKHQLIILDIPLLFEAQMNDLCDKVIVVYTPAPLAIKRLMKRNNLSQAQAEIRVKSQMDIELKKEKADFVIDNSGDIQTALKQAEKLIEDLLQIKS